MLRHPLVNPQFVRELALFRSLDDTQIAEVGALLKERHFRKGDIIFHQDDPGDCLFIIDSGQVRIYLLNTDGREITIRIYGPATMFGEFAVLDGKRRSASAVAIADATTFVLYRDDFMDLLRGNFAIVERVISLLTERLRYTTTYSEHLAFLSGPSRLAAVLVELAHQKGTSQDPVRLQFTQYELATFVNTSREWVSKCLGKFADQGLIRVDKGAVVVLDRLGLEQSIT
jgi:CRP/FNR family transcriptional regulator/CRP/FNR family cyclic AMP-dependent transcriptional regulator